MTLALTDDETRSLVGFLQRLPGPLYRRPSSSCWRR
jgi:hypothetical protein